MNHTQTTAPRRVLLLGPQGHVTNAAEALDRLDVGGAVATVTAGWEERESEDAELSEELGGRTRNLGLYPRAEEVFREDVEVREILYGRYDRLRELQGLYRMRLAGQLQACRDLLESVDPNEPGDLVGPAIEDAVRGVIELDAHHQGRVAQLDAEIAERLDVESRPSLQRHIQELAQLLEGAEALLLAGGHVAILLNRLRLFRVMDLTAGLPIVAWSGGAMVLGERIVLFHDSPPQGPGDAEVLSPGLSLIQGVLPLPHAKHRLRLDDPARVALLARRFAPDLCVCMDGGELLEGQTSASNWTLSDGARLLQTSGQVLEEQPA